MALNNTQYDALMRMYSARQQKNARDLEKRRQEAYEKLPQLRQLDEEVARLGVERAKALIDHPDSKTESFAGELARISARRASLLRGAGYPEDFLEMHYTCPDCKDTGYIGRERCRCMRRAAIDLLYTQSGIRPILEKEHFGAFRLDYYPEDMIHPTTGLSARANMANILQTCLAFVRDFDRHSDNLFFYGETGLGKTFLSHCIAGSLIESSHSVIYYSAFDLFESLAKETFGKDAGQEGSYDWILDSDLLIIDDLGTELTNAFVTSRLFLILNERLRRGRSTLISTNLSLPSFARIYSERIFSRITSSYQVLGFFGNDIRIRKKLESSSSNR